MLFRYGADDDAAQRGASHADAAGAIRRRWLPIDTTPPQPHY